MLNPIIPITKIRSFHPAFFILLYSNYRLLSKFSQQTSPKLLQIISTQTQLLYFCSYLIRYSTNVYYYQIQSRLQLMPLKIVQAMMPLLIFIYVETKKKEYHQNYNPNHPQNGYIPSDPPLMEQILEIDRFSLNSFWMIWILILATILAGFDFYILAYPHPISAYMSGTPLAIKHLAFIPQLLKFYEISSSQVCLPRINEEMQREESQIAVKLWLELLAISNLVYLYEMSDYFWNGEYFWFWELLGPVFIFSVLFRLDRKSKKQNMDNQIRQNILNKQSP